MADKPKKTPPKPKREWVGDSQKAVKKLKARDPKTVERK
jgi:hypothetical protein